MVRHFVQQCEIDFVRIHECKQNIPIYTAESHLKTHFKGYHFSAYFDWKLPHFPPLLKAFAMWMKKLIELIFLCVLSNLLSFCFHMLAYEKRMRAKYQNKYFFLVSCSFLSSSSFPSSNSSIPSMAFELEYREQIAFWWIVGYDFTV